MIKNMRCQHCGRKRKRSHEKWAADMMKGNEVEWPYCRPLLLHPENRSYYKLRYREIHGGSLQQP